METTASDGKRYQVDYYNLDMILSVGYRVNSQNAVLAEDEVLEKLNELFMLKIAQVTRWTS